MQLPKLKTRLKRKQTLPRQSLSVIEKPNHIVPIVAAQQPIQKPQNDFMPVMDRSAMSKTLVHDSKEWKDLKEAVADAKKNNRL